MDNITEEKVKDLTNHIIGLCQSGHIYAKDFVAYYEYFQFLLGVSAFREDCIRLGRCLLKAKVTYNYNDGYDSTIERIEGQIRTTFKSMGVNEEEPYHFNF